MENNRTLNILLPKWRFLNSIVDGCGINCKYGHEMDFVKFFKIIIYIIIGFNLFGTWRLVSDDLFILVSNKLIINFAYLLKLSCFSNMEIWS